MEPLTTATTFTTIVSLVASFKSERKSQSNDEFQDFLEWLIETNHTDIKSLLEINTNATIGIKTLLNKNSKELQEKLSGIDEILASIASNIDGLSEIAKAVRPNSEISEQALSILRQFEEKEASKILESNKIGGRDYLFLDGKGGSLLYDDPRFLDDDFSTLYEFGLLRQDYNSQGSKLYIITRNGAKLVALSE